MDENQIEHEINELFKLYKDNILISIKETDFEKCVINVKKLNELVYKNELSMYIDKEFTKVLKYPNQCLKYVIDNLKGCFSNQDDMYWKTMCRLARASDDRDYQLSIIRKLLKNNSKDILQDTYRDFICLCFSIGDYSSVKALKERIIIR